MKMLIIYGVFMVLLGYGDTKFLEAELINDSVKNGTIINELNLQLLKVKEDRYYYIGIGMMVNWFEAMEFCATHNMHLLSLETQGEQRIVENILYQLVRPKIPQYFWTSGNAWNQDYVWVWMSTGESVRWMTEIYKKVDGAKYCLALQYTKKGRSESKHTFESCGTGFNAAPICEAPLATSHAKTKGRIKLLTTDPPGLILDFSDWVVPVGIMFLTVTVVEALLGSTRFSNNGWIYLITMEFFCILPS